MEQGTANLAQGISVSGFIFCYIHLSAGTLKVIKLIVLIAKRSNKSIFRSTGRQ